MYDKQWDKRINRRKIIALTALGLSVLGVYVLHAISGEENMRTEILSIIASFHYGRLSICFYLKEKVFKKSFGIWHSSFLKELSFSLIHEYGSSNVLFKGETSWWSKPDGYENDG